MTTEREAPATTPRNATRRVTLAQLMLWMFATCLVLSQDAWEMRSIDNLGANQRLYFNLHTLVWSPLKGAGLAALLLWSWQRLRGRPQLGSHPGHWFLIILGADFVAGCVGEWLRAWIGDVELQAVPYWAWKIDRYLHRFFDIALYGAAIAQFRGFRWWQAAFAAMTLTPMADIIDGEVIARFFGPAWLGKHEWAWSIALQTPYTLAAALAVAAIMSDRRCGIRRDFLHFAGAAAAIASPLVGWPMWIGWWIIFR